METAPLQSVFLLLALIYTNCYKKIEVVMKFAKYSLTYLFPALACLAIAVGGWQTIIVPVVGFVVIPMIEIFWKGTSENATDSEQANRRQSGLLYDLLLHGMVLTQWGLIGGLSWRIAEGSFSALELVGCVMSVGICSGTFGINIAHELGHRTDRFSHFSSKCLLLSSLYMHFFIEHNRGHHRHVGTKEDPATSRRGETVYRFWLRSITQSWLSAWKLEKHRLARRNLNTIHWRNEMIWFTLIQISTILVVAATAGWLAAIGFVSAALVGILLLETVNYVEHYGLQRERRPNGRYERVRPHHSWNSNHPIGRALLFELSRHSDHHANPTRPYYVLRHFDESPQLPTGYPGMVLLSLIPTVWFAVMDPHVDREISRLDAITA
jgi:alkane 1-monooxygenase